MEEIGLKKIRMIEDLSDDINTLLKKFSIEHRTNKEFMFKVLFSLVPPLVLIFLVLGSIIMGIAISFCGANRS